VTTRRLHYLDPQLLGLDGHYFHYGEEAVRELTRREIPVSIHGRQGSRLVCAGRPVQSLFSRDIFQEAWSDSTIWALENYQNLNRAFLAELLQLPPGEFSADDVAFFPSLIENQLHGVAQWVGRLPAARRPAVVVLLRFLNHTMDYLRARPHHDLIPLHYRHAARALLAAQPRSLLCADTAEMAAAYQEITGLPVHQVPIAMESQAREARPGAQPGGPGPVVAFLGQTSKLRGFHHLPPIIAQAVQEWPALRFVVQVQSRPAALREKLEAVLQALDRLAGRNLRLIEGALSSSDYFSLLGEADIVLLPYAPQFYGHCSSGIFAEAAAAGKVIVVPAGTVGAGQAAAYGLGVVVAAGWNPPSLGAAVAQAVRQLPALRIQAAAAAGRFRREQGVQAFWEQILTVLPRPTVAAAA
jgi:glycosyltransferase involved in cell wall biosynthesis